ncbi:MAG: hypothetical protein ACR2GU_03225 [Rubrobacteraceae bacterium]
MTGDTFEAAATRYERLAGEPERAAKRARVEATHYRDRNVPRGCAHAFAAQGHMRNARQLLDDLAVLHASESRPEL